MAQNNKIKRGLIEGNVDFLRSQFDFCSETGVLRRKKGKAILGRFLQIQGLSFSVSRLCLVIHSGVPIEEGKVLVYLNENNCDNRPDNLRLISYAASNKNRTFVRELPKGVYLRKRDGSFAAQIRIDGKAKHLGVFASVDAAARAYADAVLLYPPQI